MLDLTPTTALSLLIVAGLCAGLVLQRSQLGRLGSRAALLEQRMLAAEQKVGAQEVLLSTLQGALAKSVAAGVRAQAQHLELCARIEALEAQASSERPYGNAIRLVRQGAREARLVDELGLSPIEASLIVRLHGGCAAH